jgi:hypothetical protein
MRASWNSCVSDLAGEEAPNRNDNRRIELAKMKISPARDEKIKQFFFGLFVVAHD